MLSTTTLVSTLMVMCVFFSVQSMDGLPDCSIASVLLFLDVKQTHKCACISKKWSLPAEQRLKQIEEEAAQKRNQVDKLEFLQ